MRSYRAAHNADRIMAELPSPEVKRAIRFAMSGPFGKLSEEDPKTMIEIVAQSLSAAQICDICRAWLDSDDATHWGKFEKELDRLIVTHGRFE